MGVKGSCPRPERIMTAYVDHPSSAVDRSYTEGTTIPTFTTV